MLNLRTNTMSNNNQIEQEQIIEAIIQRIKDEEKKHSKSIEDWYRIAANKIYATFDIKMKAIIPIELPNDEGIESRYNKFIDTEIQLGFLKQEQGERLKWYYKTYFIDKIQGGKDEQ